MTILHSGTSRKYSSNWDSVFGDPPAKSAGGKKSAEKKKSTKKAAAKTATKKATRK